MCCGNSRAQARRGFSSPPPPRPAQETASHRALGRYPGATFEYVGGTGLTVRGPVTGRQYRFDRPGARVEVDPRDRASVAAVPVLRAVGPSTRGAPV